MDPNFSLLLGDKPKCGDESKSNNTKLAIAIAVPVAVVLISLLIFFIIYIRPRITTWHCVRNSKKQGIGKDTTEEGGKDIDIEREGVWNGTLLLASTMCECNFN